jgi:hypothetical protein
MNRPRHPKRRADHATFGSRGEDVTEVTFQRLTTSREAVLFVNENNQKNFGLLGVAAPSAGHWQGV